MQIMNVDRYMKLLSNYDYFGTYDKFPVACNIYKKFEIQKNIQGMRFYTGNVDAPICAIYINLSVKNMNLNCMVARIIQ